MLYNPKWERLSLAGFEAWLEQQDPNATFFYGDCDSCAVGQYLISIGTSWRKESAEVVTGLNKFACFAATFGDTENPTFGTVLREVKFALSRP